MKGQSDKFVSTMLLHVQVNNMVDILYSTRTIQ